MRQRGAKGGSAAARRARHLIALGAFGWGLARPATAAPPGRWSVSVERLFGMTRVSSRRGGQELETRSYSVLSDPAPDAGYSSPRAAADHVLGVGLSLGGALGLHHVTLDGRSLTAWVLAPRVGYLWHFSPFFALWPRAGVTRLWLQGAAEDETALTLELPFMVLLSQQRLGLTLTPHLEVGLPGGDASLHERGAQLGAAVFF